MENCCANVQIQWYPNQAEPGKFFLGCASCGAPWAPWSPQEVAPPAPPMAPFEAQVITKLDAIMNEFEIVGGEPVVAILTGEMEGGGVHQVAWENLVATIDTQKSWTKGKLATEMARILGESSEPESAETEDEQETPF